LAVRQLEQVDPTTLVSTVPQTAVETVPAVASTVVAQEATTTVDPATAAVEVASLPVDSTLVTSAEVLPVDTTGTAVPAGTGEVASVSTQAGSAATAVTAYTGKTLGVSFSGSGYLIMYHVGVTAVLRALGFFDKTVTFAGASGGSVAAAYSCSKGIAPLTLRTSQQTFRDAVGSLAVACRLTNCLYTLDTTLRAPVPGSLLFSFASVNTAADCRNKLHVAVTQANDNRLSPAAAQKDKRVFVYGNNVSTSAQITDAVALSSYIPAFSGRTVVTVPINNIGVAVGYDGVATDPLPVPPATSATYTVKVSAVVNTTNPMGPPTTVFDYLVDRANNRTLLTMLNITCNDILVPCYTPLDPVKLPQPATVDIYPGRSGSLPTFDGGNKWNDFVLKVPSVNDNKKLYNQGREDAKAWVQATFGATFTFTTATGTAVTLNAAYLGTAITPLDVAW